mmetsp:Transcript_27114/g.46606  ORF Transcript_27114/g.46606 Transcript_27114/m.46606 type:complete len:86 (+) Transcript_27114:222-479(+)
MGVNTSKLRVGMEKRKAGKELSQRQRDRKEATTQSIKSAEERWKKAQEDRMAQQRKANKSGTNNNNQKKKSNGRKEGGGGLFSAI